MRAFNHSRLLTPFRPGDPLFEHDRARLLPTPVEPVPMTVLKGDINLWSGLEQEQQALNQAVGDALELHDFKTLSAGLQFLKFDAQDAETILNLVSTAAGIISTVGAVVSAFETAQKVFDMLGIGDSGGFDIEQAIQEMSATVKQIYGYLEGVERKGLYIEAGAWRNKVGQTTAAVATCTISPSPSALNDLSRLAQELDAAIGEMLLIERGSIAFSRSSYGPSSLWLAVSGSPYLVRADGAPTAALTDLSSFVWDPGHYIDILAAAIRLRIVVATAMEPLYRSTGYRRADIERIVPQLRTFLDHWRASLWVANPDACVLSNGTVPLYNHLLNSDIYAPGILIGAMCPVTGVSSLQVFGGFAQQHEIKHRFGADGELLPTKIKATNPGDALSQARVRHFVLLDQVIKACGLFDFEMLYRRLQEAAKPPIHSESVRFATAQTQSQRPPGAGPIGYPELVFVPTQATVDLGTLKRWSVNPDKTYPAMRHYPVIEKVATFRMARRALLSHVRLGYKLRINDQVFELTGWDIQPPPEQTTLDWFPAAPIEQELSLQTKLYDCVQSRRLSIAEEESFDESGEAGTAERVFINQRDGTAMVQIRIEFQALAENQNNAYLGEVKVTVRALDQINRPDAFLLDFDVLETHLDDSRPPSPVEVTVDGPSIHVVPSYLIVGADFFADYYDAWERMLRTKAMTALNTRLIPDLADVPTRPDPRPKFLTTQMAASIATNAAVLQLAERRPEFAARVQRHLIPRIER